MWCVYLYGRAVLGTERVFTPTPVVSMLIRRVAGLSALGLREFPDMDTS